MKSSKNIIIAGSIVIDRGDTKRTVKEKLGKPSYIGTTIEGYQFYRYEDKEVEIYFNGNNVVNWAGRDFIP